MLAGSVGDALYPEWLARIESDDARDAFHYLVGRAASLKSFACHPQQKGVISDFRFIATNGDEMPFAFIPNKRWLLFYFRAPAARSAKYSLAALAVSFDSARENGSGEWTVKLRSLTDAQRLWQILSID